MDYKQIKLCGSVVDDKNLVILKSYKGINFVVIFEISIPSYNLNIIQLN